MTTPTYALQLLPPGRMSIDIAGSSIESGRSLSGITGAVDMSGGGLWTVQYSQITVFERVEHLYYQYLRNYLRGGVRSIIVPMLTDYVAPTPIVGGPLWTPGMPFSDGSSWSDGSLWGQSTIQAAVVGNWPLNAGTIQIKIISGGLLQGGETFSINHLSPKWHRCYGISEIDSQGAPDENGAITYQVAIAPSLRAAVADQTPLEFARPRCLMRLAAGGAGMPWSLEPYQKGIFDIQFIESFMAS